MLCVTPRCFSAALVNNPSLAVHAAGLAPKGTWMHAAGDACVRQGLRGDRVRVGAMDDFPEAQVLLTGFVSVTALSPKGDMLAVVDRETVGLFDTITGTLTVVTEVPSVGNQAKGMQFSPDGAMLMMWTRHELHIVDCASGVCQTLKEDVDFVHDAGFVDGGKAVGAVTLQGYCQWSVPGVWQELAVPGALGAPNVGTPLVVQLGMMGGDGTWVAVKHRGSSAQVFDVQSGQLRAELEGSLELAFPDDDDDDDNKLLGPNLGIAASVAGTVLTAAVPTIGSVLVWDTKAGEHRGTIDGVRSWVSGTGSLVATRTAKGAVVYDAETLQERARIPLEDRDTPVCFSPEGTLLLIASMVGDERFELRLHDTSSGGVRTVFRANGAPGAICMDPAWSKIACSTTVGTTLV